MYASSSLQSYGATIPDDDDDDRRDLSDNEYVFGDDDDDDNLDITENITPSDIPPPLVPYYPGITTCIVCQKRPPYSKNGKSFPTCGINCARVLENAMNQSTPLRGAGSTRGRGRGFTGTVPHAGSSANKAPQNTSPQNTSPTDTSQTVADLVQHLASHRAPRAPRAQGRGGHVLTPSSSGNPIRAQAGSSTITIPRPAPRPAPSTDPCVVCQNRPCYDAKYVTCGLACAEKLCRQGAADKTLCDYCHRRPKLAGHNQCGKACADSAKVACLLCKSRPKFKRYHLCGKTCKSIAVKVTPLILEAPPGHATYELVESKFKSGWKVTAPPCPQIRKVYKIIENKNFLQPYDRYKKSVGNEVFRYHGTTRKCSLGSPGNTQLCGNAQCALCCILRTSFKTSLANPSGAFGPGIYTSSAANKAYSYSGGGSGAVLLTKVVLGNVRNVNAWNEVMSCPPGFNSVVFDRQNGQLNETIIYQDEAIRPVFLIIF